MTELIPSFGLFKSKAMIDLPFFDNSFSALIPNSPLYPVINILSFTLKVKLDKMIFANFVLPLFID